MTNAILWIVDLGNFVAIDWGTTNRRAYLIEDGVVTHSERDDRGISAIPEGGFDAEIDALQARFAGHPILLAGMAAFCVSPVMPGLKLSAHIGRQKIENGVSYNDWKLGATQSLGGFDIGLFYVDTDVNNAKLARERVILSISRAF